MKPDKLRPAFPADVLVYEVSHLFELESTFVAVRAAETVGPRLSMLVLRLDGVPNLDSRGTQVIAGLMEHCRRASARLLLVGVAPQPLESLRNAGVAATLGEIGFCRDLDEALQVSRDYASRGPNRPRRRTRA